jgi:hypothetical protein
MSTESRERGFLTLSPVLLFKDLAMETLVVAPVLAAAGYSLIYLLLGGGLGGAILIFVLLKLIGK